MKQTNLIIVENLESDQIHFAKAEKDFKEIKKFLKLEQNYFGTHIFAVAYHEDFELNKKIEISTNNLGSCLTPEVHDTVNDLCYLEGVDYFEVGRLPISYRFFMEDNDWDVHVPLPLSVIKRYLTKKQKDNLDLWCNKFKNQNCKIKFVQFLGLC